MVEDEVDVDEMLQQETDTDLRTDVENLAPGETDQHAISSEMNVYQGVLNTSMYQVGDEPRIVVYDHSPGFEQGQTGYGVLHARNMKDSYTYPENGGRRVSQRTTSRTGIIPLEVGESEYLPGPHYQGEGVVEMMVEHNGHEFQEDHPAMLKVIPFDPSSLNNADLEEVLGRYDPDENDINDLT